MRLSTALVFVPVAILAVLVAVANRQVVSFSLDPFSREPLALELPLYLLVFATFFMGVLLGGLAVALRRTRRSPPPVAVADHALPPPGRGAGGGEARS